MKPLLTVTAVGLGSFGVGALLGYKFAQRGLTKEFEERLEKETAQMRVFYRTVKKPYATPQEAAADLIQETPVDEDPEESPAERTNSLVAYHKIVKAEYESTNDPEEEQAVEAEFGVAPVVANNVFTDQPHLILEEEYSTEESGYIQGSLTYYKVDNVLTDERDDVIEDKDATIGDKNLTMFGDSKSGSADANIIYVRNPRLQMEFEVCLSENSYRREVLGIDEDPPRLPSGRER